MQWTGMGKVTVTTPGTPIPLSTNALKIHTVLITYDPADATATVMVTDAAGHVIAAMANASAQPIQFTSPSGNQLDLRNFQIDAGAGGKGPYVGYGVE